jgi:hypothetical protein
MLIAGTQVRIRKEVLPSYAAEFQGRVDENRIAVVEKSDNCHGWAYLVFPRLGRKREFRAGWFDPKNLEVVPALVR